MTCFDDDRQDLVEKPVEFRRWFESIEVWIRTKYKAPDMLTCAGPGAERFRYEVRLLH